MPFARLVMPAICIFAAAAQLAAQRVTVINPSVACPRCRIVLNLGPRLGDVDGPGALVAEPSSLSRDSRGRFFLTQFSTDQGPLVFDSVGRFIRELGRQGSGPGEFRVARYLSVAPDGRIFVADPVAGRMTVFTPALTYDSAATDIGLALAYPFEVLRQGQVVVGADVSMRDRIGYPLHLYGPALEFITSFGTDTPSFRPDRRMSSRRRLARSSDGGVWAAHATEYVIDRFDGAGRRTLRLVRRAPWFEPHDAPTLNVDPEPKPRMMAVSEDSLGRLWVLLVVKDPRWRSALGWNLPSRLGGGRSPLPVIMDNDAYFDTLIEIIDVKTSRILVSQRFPQALLFMTGPNYLGTRREDASGAFYMQLWSATLRP